MTLISDFIAKVQTIHATGMATEHSYRSAFVRLFTELGVTALNEPKRVKCGAPDFILLQEEIVIGHLEAKDLHIPIRKLKDNNKKQQERYRAALPNLIYTNGLAWDFYCDGNLTASVTIADVFMGGIAPKQDQYETLENLLHDFIAQRPQTITSPRELAERMAGKASLIKDVLYNTLREDDELQTELADQYQAFKENLIHDIKPEEFADIYAETIAYGMFAARLHDIAPDNFNRQKALELLPKSNPFLRNLFTYVAGYNLDDRIAWIIDDLARVFRACKMEDLMEGFGQLTGRNDPFLHFYETFLAAYNPAKRKARGIWYTPEPVVNFIVRAVDEVLQTEFDLPDGLADTSKVTIDQYIGQDDKGKPVTIKKEVHRVQILDPATGTGTFLAEIIKQIAPRIQDVAPGLWSSYIEADLIPRLHGFELLMASYAMCHMKLDMILTKLGYRPRDKPPRLSVYLTNSLEEGELVNQTLPFAQWISREAKGANTIKRDMPIMCVIGNPPYSGVSSNKGEWATSLIASYQKEPGGRMKLRERNSKWINDDYVKFIAFSEHVISKTGEGILGFITNHSYIDNPTFRGMRWHLMQSFDKLYILDLHGSSKKKEIAPDGSNDFNVFNIEQGVAVLIGVKHHKAAQPAKKSPVPSDVFHAELWGTQRHKYDCLQQFKLSSLSWNKLDLDPTYLMFYPINRKLLETYDVGFSLVKFMPQNKTGFQSHRDRFAISFDRTDMEKRLKDMMDYRITDDDFQKRYGLSDNCDWKKMRTRAKSDQTLSERIVPCDYRPFDRRFCMLDTVMMDRPRLPLLNNSLLTDNFCLNFVRQTKSPSWQHGLVSRFPTPALFVEIKDGSSFAPFFIREDIEQTRHVNFDPILWKKLCAKATCMTHGAPDELAAFDYIYGVLHCPVYRKTYAEFLKIDFPRIPWPSNPSEFWDVSAKGAKLRKLHLMDPVAIGQTPYPFMGEGDDMVKKPRFKDGRIYINATQYFDSTPDVSWGFYIGGYQPARKWLKDRKGRPLTFDDVKHYQRILKILSETDRIMGTINMTLH